MADKQAIKKEMDFCSDRLSTQVRYVCVTLIALTWCLIMDQPSRNAATGVIKDRLFLLVSIGFLASLSLIVDFFQYVVGYWVSRRLLNRIEESGAATGEYIYSSIGFRARYYLFCSKLFTTGAAGFLFLGLCVLIVFNVFSVSKNNANALDSRYTAGPLQAEQLSGRAQGGIMNEAGELRNSKQAR